MSTTTTDGRRWIVLATVLVGTFVGATNGSVANIAVLDVLGEFDLDVSAGAWFVLGYIVSFVVLMPVAGRLADRVGLRRVYLAGMALFALASAAVAVGSTYVWVIVARILQGVGAASILPVVMLVISRTFPLEARGRAMGMWASANGAGLALGPVLGGLIVGASGWRMIFWLDVPLGVLALVLAYVVLPADRRSTGGRADIAGAALLCGGLAAVTVGFSLPFSLGVVSILQVVSVAIGAALLVGAQHRAARARSDLESLVGAEVLRNGAFSALTAIAGVQATLLAMLLFVTPLALSLVFGLTVAVVGAVTFLLPLSMVVFGPPSGYLSDRIGVRRLAKASALLLVASSAMLAAGVASRTLASVVGGLVIGGIGVACTQAPIAASATGRMGEHHQGAAMGLFHSARFAGGVLGTSVSASVVALLGPSGSAALALSNEVQRAATGAYLVAMLVAVLMGALVWLVRPRHWIQRPSDRPSTRMAKSARL